MNRREAFAAAIGAVVAAMLPRPTGPADDIAKIFGHEPASLPPFSYQQFLAEEARFVREVVEPTQHRLLKAMAADIDRQWAALDS